MISAVAPQRDLANKRILVTNDDGINAPGLKVLEKLARRLSKDVWVVAPETQQSATSHSLTIQRPLRMHRLTPRRFAVGGTPTDCALMALKHVLKDAPPDLVLSGVNHGANLSEDVLYSGTVAAATEATQCGIPAIAMSQCLDDRQKLRWSAVEGHGEAVIRSLCAAGWPANVMMNVNFPPLLASAVIGVRVTALGRRDADLKIKERIDPDGRPYYWMVDFADITSRRGNSDLRAIQDGLVAVTPLSLNRTHRPSIARLRGVVGR